MTNPPGPVVPPDDPSEHARYRLDHRDGCAVVTVGGDIDIYTAPGLHDAIKVATTFSSHVIIDLTDVDFLDSTGLGVLVRARTHAQAHHGRVVLVHPPSLVTKILHVTKLDETFTIHDRVEDAVAWLSDPHTQPSSELR
jgi:anti-sigma B factor antagonist